MPVTEAMLLTLGQAEDSAGMAPGTLKSEKQECGQQDGVSACAMTISPDGDGPAFPMFISVFDFESPDEGQQELEDLRMRDLGLVMKETANRVVVYDIERGGIAYGMQVDGTRGAVVWCGLGVNSPDTGITEVVADCVDRVLAAQAEKAEVALSTEPPAWEAPFKAALLTAADVKHALGVTHDFEQFFGDDCIPSRRECGRTFSTALGMPGPDYYDIKIRIFESESSAMEALDEYRTEAGEVSSSPTSLVRTWRADDGTMFADALAVDGTVFIDITCAQDETTSDRAVLPCAEKLMAAQAPKAASMPR